MNIKKLLPINGKEVITFTPTKTGILPFSCAMGMYTGQFEVI
jgi:plastocyanin domain-containing protein